MSSQSRIVNKAVFRAASILRLIPQPAARRFDPDTSKAAAARAAEFASGHHARVFNALATPGTIYEIGMRCGLDHVAVARRLPELARAGMVEPTSERRDGCRVWRQKDPAPSNDGEAA